MALIQGQVGPSSPSVVQPNIRCLGDGAVAVADGHARYQEAVYRGNVFGVWDTAGGLVPAGLSASPITVSLYNPLGSGVNLVLWYAKLALLVATAAAAEIWIGVNPTGSVATTGTAKAVQNMNGGGGTGKVKGFTTATLPAAPTILGDLGVALTGAITVTTGYPSFFRWFDGAIQVGPGGALSIQMSAASAAASGLAGWIWEEVPVLFG